MSIENRLYWEAYLAALSGSNRGAEGWTYDGVAKECQEFAQRAVADFRARCGDAVLAAKVMGEEPAWKGHAKLSQFGHAEYVGRIREIDIFGACLGEIQEINPDGTYGAVHQFHGKSVYRLSKISLEQALEEVNPPKGANCYKCGRYIELQYGDPEYSEDLPRCEECREKAKQPASADSATLLEAGRTEAPPTGAVERTIAAIEQ